LREKFCRLQRVLPAMNWIFGKDFYGFGGFEMAGVVLGLEEFL